MVNKALTLGTIIQETGDFGRFQFILVAFASLSLMLLNWSMMTMAYSASVPDWTCYVNSSVEGNGGYVIEDMARSVCDINGTKCTRFLFDEGMSTVVNEWDLICDRKWVSQTMTTIQMCGLLIGGIFWGHVSDGVGRKPTFYINVFLLSACNLVAYFSVSWEMFAAMRFVIGFACTGFMASPIHFEYIRNKWRIYLKFIPSWGIWSSMMALFCWRLHQWKFIHLAIASAGVPVMLTWFFMPESFRWLISHDNVEEATKCINMVARVNRKPLPDLSKVKVAIETELEEANKSKVLRVYTAMDLFRTAHLRKITLIFSVVWAFSAFSYYGIAFGIQELSGNLYLNLFLVSVMDVPGSYLMILFNRWGGRRWTDVGFYTVGGLFALSVGIIQMMNISIPGTVFNGLALTAKLFISAAWDLNTLWSSESFPTVVRNIGGGFISSISRVGSMVAPQIITLSSATPGLLYLISGLGTIISAILCMFLQETKNRDLDDLIKVKPKIAPTAEKSVNIEKVKY